MCLIGPQISLTKRMKSGKAAHVGDLGGSVLRGVNNWGLGGFRGSRVCIESGWCDVSVYELRVVIEVDYSLLVMFC